MCMDMHNTCNLVIKGKTLHKDIFALNALYKLTCIDLVDIGWHMAWLSVNPVNQFMDILIGGL